MEVDLTPDSSVQEKAEVLKNSGWEQLLLVAQGIIWHTQEVSIIDPLRLPPEEIVSIAFETHHGAPRVRIVSSTRDSVPLHTTISVLAIHTKSCNIPCAVFKQNLQDGTVYSTAIPSEGQLLGAVELEKLVNAVLARGQISN